MDKYGLYDPAYEHDSCGIGLIADIKGHRSHQILADALEVLENMEHRGACGCEENTGDGAGILTAMPHEFLQRIVKEDLKSRLPQPGNYSAGIVFLPQDADERRYCQESLAKVVAEHGQKVIGWRDVPHDADKADIGRAARLGEPRIAQVFIAAQRGIDQQAFDRKLFVIRKRASHLLRGDIRLKERSSFYICSLSPRVIVYKGMLTPGQLARYYPDLREPEYQSHLALVHSRFSTNTFPSWDRAHPYRYVCHNGEINTLRGNINWMRARQGMMHSEFFSAEELKQIFPIIEPDCSDSGNFDNALELLVMSGRSLPEAMMMMIPEAWEHHESMSSEKRAFYEFHSCLQEPWDGPASIAFTDGVMVGAVLDRNGLRPSRYYLTNDDRVIMGSEVGLLQIDPANIKEKGCLQPGRMFLVNFEQGRLIPDDELKQDIAEARPYRRWVRSQRIDLNQLRAHGSPPPFVPDLLGPRMQAFGYTRETLRFMLIPLVEEKRDPVGSMGNDAAIACLSDQPRLTYDYFKQLFAQVTNPAIDSIREEVIMSLAAYIGPEGNLLDVRKEQAGRLMVQHPILTNEQLLAVKELNHKQWRTKVIDSTFEKPPGVLQYLSRNGSTPAVVPGSGQLLLSAIERLCSEAEQAIAEGYSLIVLSDRNVSPQRVPVSALLACGAVHHHLVRGEKRTRLGIVLETGEAREVHHHCLLVGYGADAINPYLAYEALWQANRDGLFEEDLSDDEIVASYRKGVAKGMLKVLAKMGISTLQSYKGAQIFEALGLKDEVIEKCFAGTPSRLQGVGFDVLATEVLRRHEAAYPTRPTVSLPMLANPGEFHWRAGGERHSWSPEVIAELQLAARANSKDAYRRFSQLVNDNARTRCALRGLLRFKPHGNGGPIVINQVEPAAEIVKRFCTGAMSFGSISLETHETLALAMNRLGGRSNTGEGGEDPERFKPLPNGDSKRSAIKQVASGRFGVTAWYLANADELQIKIAQGAKPGEGGELPGKKVDEFIAKVRYSTPGVGLISPPPHHDIYSIEDLKQLIYDLKNSNPEATISVKLVSEVGVGTVAAGVAKGHADLILVSGDTGGTGASPLTSIKHAGLPWELGIAETHQTLVLNDLRSRVKLQTDGGLKTGRDVVIAALLGAEEFGFSTAPLVTLGCTLMRKCHLNTCPVGIATQDPVLRRKFDGKPEFVVNYLFLVAEEAREMMAELGFRTVDEMIGRVDVLEVDDAVHHWKADGLDLTPVLAPAPKLHPAVEVRCTRKQDHGLDQALDNRLIELAQPAIEQGERVRLELPIRNINRTVGTMLSNRVVQRWGERALPDSTIHVKFNGSAGQSLGAFLCSGITLELEGDANDYTGKGLSGGKLIVYPPGSSAFRAESNIIIGNVALYGATSGQAFFRGRAAARFAVRNSGAWSVVEGVGDHACEYMTGGGIIILGSTGRNFGAGMSGGVAYVWDETDDFAERCNLGIIEVEPLRDEGDMIEVRSLIELHHKYTRSEVAEDLLASWDSVVVEFKKVVPIDYKRVMQERAIHDEEVEAVIHEEASNG